MLERFGRWVHRRRVAVLVVWAALAVLGGFLGGAAFDRAQAPGDRAGVESTEVTQRVDEAFPEGEEVVFILQGRETRSNDMINDASDLLWRMREMPGIKTIIDPYTRGATEMFADDSMGFAVQVELQPDLTDEEAMEVAERVRQQLDTLGYPQTLLGGPLAAQQLFVDQAVKDAAIGEGVALVLLFGLLVLVLGGWLIGTVPVATALAGLAVSLLALTGVSFVGPLSEYAVNVVTLLGLGLAIDYGLLVLARFREERQRAGAKADLAEVLGTTLATAGHTVLVSGITVGCSLAALLLLGDPMLTGMAIGGVVAVAVATGAGLTLAPAFLAVANRHIPAPGKGRFARVRRPSRRPLLPRLAAFAQRRPWPTLLGGGLLLWILAAPLVTLEVGNSDARSLPSGSEPRIVYEMTEELYPDMASAPLTVLVDIPLGDERISQVVQDIDDLPGTDDVLTDAPLPDGTAVLVVLPDGPTTGDVALRLVEQIRALDTAAPLQVGGPAAELVDAKADLGARVPWAVLVLVLVTGLLLLWLTRSLVVSVKTILLNLLSLAATLGVVVAVFQWGWGSSLLGFTSWGAIDITTPLLLFMFCFGLSMDYHMFLVARIREEWEAAPGGRAANDRAVLAGITSSGPVVTLAALAISFVFLGFAAGQLTAVKEIGVGMTVAILLDVTIVRGLLLPASMTLLGRWNWWRPGQPLPTGPEPIDTPPIAVAAASGSTRTKARPTADRSTRPAKGGAGDRKPSGKR